LKIGRVISALSFTTCLLKIGNAFAVVIFTVLCTMFAGPGQMATVETIYKIVLTVAAYELLTAIYNLFLGLYFLTPWSRIRPSWVSTFIVGIDACLSAFVAAIALLGAVLLVLVSLDGSALFMVSVPVSALCVRALNAYAQWTAFKSLNRALNP
jgi:hypothetical protein